MPDMTAPDMQFPAKDRMRICFAHAAYDMKPIFDRLCPGIATVQVTDYAALKANVPEADVLVVSGLWQNELLDHAPRLKYLQSVSAGLNQYDLARFRQRGILLASGHGVNANAVSDHAIALLLSLTRRIASARDNQQDQVWRPMQSNPAEREIELPGTTMLLVGLGRIGNRVARLARAFGMHVIGVRRDAAAGPGDAHEVHAFTALNALIPKADVVVLCCPLTEETRHIIGRTALAAFKPTAFLVNVARGGCVDEAALIEVLKANRIAGAGLDVTETEPLPATSPLWTLPNVMLTPHAAGETEKYEINVIDVLRQNLDRLWSGNTALVNRAA